MFFKVIPASEPGSRGYSRDSDFRQNDGRIHQILNPCLP